MPSIAFIVAAYVCPTIGAILSTLTCAAPIRALKSSMKDGSLGYLNPTPWAFMTGNCIGWIAYSYITLDLFVFFANAPGLIISIWLNVCAMKLQYYEEIVKFSSSSYLPSGDTVDENSDCTQPASEVGNNTINGSRYHRHPHPSSLTSHEWKLLQIIVIWVVILSTTSLMPVKQDGAKFVIGVAVNLNLIFFYAAPLSTIVVVLRTKNSSSIHLCTMIMNTINSLFWCIYSLAIQDHYILIPNGMGFLFVLIQMMLYKCYPPIDVTDEMGTLQLFGEDSTSNNEDQRECQDEIL